MSEYLDEGEYGLDQWPEEFYGDEGFGGEASVEEEYASEELWLYQTALDERVCGRCAPLEGVMFTLDEVNEQFPANENYEDIIFANVHDRCRCQLIRQPGTQEPGEDGGEGGREDTVEGRGIPLRRVASLGFAARNPISLGRFGLRQALILLGLPGIFAFIVPYLVQTIAQQVMNMIQQNQRYWEQIRRMQEAAALRRQYSTAVWQNRLDDAANLRLKLMANTASES